MPNQPPATLPHHLPGPVARRFMQGIFRFLFTASGSISYRGTENIPATGAVIFCPNHISDSDPAAVYLVIPRGDVLYMGKQELFRVPVLGWLFAYYGGFPVERDTADRTALRTAEAILKRGQGLVVFPEGRIARDTHLKHLQPGAAMLATRTGAPIIPVAIRGTHKILPYGKFIPQRSNEPATVTFGAPITMDSFPNLAKRELIDAITERLKVEMLALGAYE